MPDYRRLDGTKTSDRDPKRGVWYAASMACGYWTDDWSQLAKTNLGVPACPHCGCPGMQITADKWLHGAELFEKEGHPHYAEFVKQHRQLCVKGGDASPEWMTRYMGWRTQRAAAVTEPSGLIEGWPEPGKGWCWHPSWSEPRRCLVTKHVGPRKDWVWFESLEWGANSSERGRPEAPTHFAMDDDAPPALGTLKGAK